MIIENDGVEATRTVFHEQVDINLLQRDAHTGTFEIGQHDEFDIGRRFIVVKLVLAGRVGNKAGRKRDITLAIIGRVYRHS